jgi:hypothetical protein
VQYDPVDLKACAKLAGNLEEERYNISFEEKKKESL